MFVKLICATLLFGLLMKQYVIRGQFFFEECLTIVDDFVTKAILPEVIGQYFTRQPQKTKKRPLSESDLGPNTLHSI